MAVGLSLVIPAFNEENRLPRYLSLIHSYFLNANREDYEVIVVDDGSRDRTAEIVTGWAKDWRELSLLRHPTNLGKGAAVRSGVLAAQGDRILFADADGATPIEEERKFCEALDRGADIAVGSRFLPLASASCQRSLYRKICGRLFVLSARTIIPISVLDTQCGFKIFRRDVAKVLFAECKEDGYLFDMFILAVANQLEFTTVELPIHWNEIPGSKISLAGDFWKIALGLARLRTDVAKTCEKLRADGTFGKSYFAPLDDLVNPCQAEALKLPP